VNSILALNGYPDDRFRQSSRQLPRPARMITLDVRRWEREAALLCSPVRNDDPLVRSSASPQAVTAPHWTLVLSALKTLLETGQPLPVSSGGKA
jgi:hypothetical protein